MEHTALVTGGNRGIGREIVKGLARKVTTVLLGCRDVESGQQIASSLGDHVHAVRIDLCERQSLRDQISQIQHSYPAVDILVNNAGVLHEGNFLEGEDGDFSQSLFVNLEAPYELMRAFLPGMIERGYGRVVNMTSGWGSFGEGLEGPTPYSVTKAALNALTLSASRAVSGNVKINSVCPGWVRTEMGGPEAPRTPEQGAQTPIWLATLPDDGPNGGFFRDREPIEW
ncbi:MAG: SDR family NAD(P)-dependent oxidoreductase [Bdellovibrionales bacterium]|nr:SDR family NAD(P)-dependent oxidoreductase [Bdellovibrionales bacterium]